MVSERETPRGLPPAGLHRPHDPPQPRTLHWRLVDRGMVQCRNVGVVLVQQRGWGPCSLRAVEASPQASPVEDAVTCSLWLSNYKEWK